MTFTYSIEGPSNSGKTTLVRMLASESNADVLPDAGDLISVFPPAPRAQEDARRNERFCLQVEITRSALTRTGWGTAPVCIFDRSALSMLAISFGYAHRFGEDAFADLCHEVSDYAAKGDLLFPDVYVYLRVPVPALQARNSTRRPPLAEYWMDTELLERQLAFYDAWAEALAPVCITVETDHEMHTIAGAVHDLQVQAAKPALPIDKVLTRLACWRSNQCLPRR